MRYFVCFDAAVDVGVRAQDHESFKVCLCVKSTFTAGKRYVGNVKYLGNT